MKQIVANDAAGYSISHTALSAGQSLKAYIEQTGDDLQTFAAKAGISRVTLYRLLRGENSGTDTLFRVLRALHRTDILLPLCNPPPESPESLYKKNNTQKTKKRASLKAAGTNASDSAASLGSQMELPDFSKIKFE